ncbi:hypothetical protein O0L34_g11666 [Tuta absoluta]|nr:hypothetical protein O0L34_g11666 [Tuta absoluta]
MTFCVVESDYIGGKRRKPLRASLIAQIEQETSKWQEQKPIKSEPSDKSPLHMGSPHYVPLDRNWLNNPMAGLGEAGAMPYYGGDQWPAPTYQTLTAPRLPAMSTSPHSPHTLPAASPVHHLQGMPQGLSPQQQQVLSPQHQQQIMSPQQQQQIMSPQQQQQIMSPQQQQQIMSPQQQQQIMSPQHQQQIMSPQHQQQIMSPQHQQVLSPQHQQIMSPQHQVMSPQQHPQQVMSPHMGLVSPHLMQADQQHQQQQQVHQEQQPMETSTPSLSGLLAGEGEFTSGDLSTLSAMLGAAAQPYPSGYRQDGLTDSLTRLSTSDLFPRTEL